MEEFLKIFCISTITLSGLFLLSPENKLKKILKFSYCLVLIICVFSSFNKIKIDLPKIDTETSKTTILETTNKQVAETIFAITLKNNNIDFSKIEVCTDKNESDSIIITKVNIYSNCPAYKIKNLLSTNGTYEVNVINE